MNQSPQITFRNIAHSDAVEATVHHRLEKIESLYRGLGQWHVVIDAPHRHRAKGNHFHVRVGVTFRGKPILVGHPHETHHAAEDIYEAVNDAFDAVERQLKTLREKQRERRREGSRAYEEAYDLAQ